MNNLRNMRRMRMLAFLFALVFVTGAAFAFTPGTLTINGRVNIVQAASYVRWTSPSALWVSGGTGNVSVYGARGRTDQVLSFEVTFNAPGSGWVQLEVVAVNDNPTLAAVLGTPVVTYNAAVAAAHGITVMPDLWWMTWGNIAPLSTSNPGWIFINWDGTLPPGFNSDAVGTNPVLTIEVSMNYTAVAP